MTKTSVSAMRAGRREWIGLAVIALPCLLYSMDLTVLTLAVPSLSADLRPTSVQLLWIEDIYGFVLAGSLMTMGALGDRIGRRRLLLIGAGAFAVGSVLAAFSTSAAMLIATRALLGLAGATLAPSTLSLIRSMFLDARERQIAIGVWIASFSAGATIGPLVGGVMLEHFWWGSVFLVGVPAMALLLVLGPVLLPEFTDPDAGRMDVISAALSLVGVLLVIVGLKKIAQDGLGSAALLSIVAGLAVGGVFLRRQRRLTEPLIDPRLFENLAFNVSLAVYTLASFVALGMFVFASQYLQLALGLSPLYAGLWTMPFGATFVVGSLLTPVIAHRVRPTLVVASGLTIAAVGFGVLAQAGGTAGVIVPAVGMVLYALGLAPVVTLATDLIVGSAPPEHAGAVAAISETGSELGGALGIAILGSLVTAVYRGALAHAMPAGIPTDAAVAARDTLGGALAVATHLSEPLGAELVGVARAAFTRAVACASIVSAGVMLAAAIATMLLLRDVGAGDESGRYADADDDARELRRRLQPIPSATE